MRTPDFLQVFSATRPDRRPLFYNRAFKAFLRGIGYDMEESLPPAGQLLPRDVSLNVFLQYIEAVPSERVHSLDMDSLRHIVDYIFPIIYLASAAGKFRLTRSPSS